MKATVVITGANSLVGQMLIPVLKERDYTIVTLSRKPFSSQADENITDWTTSGKAIDALKGADFVVHLSGEIFARKWAEFYQSNVKTTKIVADALKNSSVKKVIFISYPGANAASDNLFLKSKGQAEKLLISRPSKSQFYFLGNKIPISI